MAENHPGAAPPVSGNDDVDAALAGLGDLSDLPAAAALARLTAAQEALSKVLAAPQDHVLGPILGVGR